MTTGTFKQIKLQSLAIMLIVHMGFMALTLYIVTRSNVGGTRQTVFFVTMSVVGAIIGSRAGKWHLYRELSKLEQSQ